MWILLNTPLYGMWIPSASINLSIEQEHWSHNIIVFICKHYIQDCGSKLPVDTPFCHVMLISKSKLTFSIDEEMS